MYFVPFGICAVYKYTGLSARLAGGGRMRQLHKEAPASGQSCAQLSSVH